MGYTGKSFNIPVFFHRIIVRKRVHKIPHLLKRRMNLHVYFYVDVVYLFFLHRINA